MSKFRIVDLFSGAGGLTFGFYYNLVNGEFVKRDNVEFVFSNEYAPQAVKAFKKNYGKDIPVIEGDICDITDDIIEQYVDGKEVDVIIGGPPCQSFSTVGQRQYDDRAKLSNQYLRILEKIKPKAFLFENVKGKYLEPDNWVSTYFTKGVEWCGISSQEVNKFDPWLSGSKDKSEDDCINAIRLHEAFKITPLQATNKYMWAYMCHVDDDCRKYMRYRWSDSKPEQRYFVPGEGMGLYYFNGLSRLWWWAHLTYDPDSKDHYTLTRILFENQMLGKDILDTLNRTNFKRMKGILLAIQEFKGMVGPNEGITDYFRECKKELNHYAAISIFDYLDFEDIKKITLETLIKVREQAKKE